MKRWTGAHSGVSHLRTLGLVEGSPRQEAGKRQGPRAALRLVWRVGPARRGPREGGKRPRGWWEELVGRISRALV